MTKPCEDCGCDVDMSELDKRYAVLDEVVDYNHGHKYVVSPIEAYGILCAECDTLEV